MFTSMKEYEKQLNTLNPEQKIKHNDNTMNELKELYYYYSDSSNAINMANILKNLKELYVTRLSIEQLNSTPIDSSVKFLINIANKYFKSIESSDDEDIEVPHSSEKSSDYFKILKYKIPAHYDGVFG